MNKPELEFVISGYVTGESGRHTLIGRCGDRAIHRGDVFHLAVRPKQRAFPHQLENPLEQESREAVELRVDHIQTYGRCVEMLGEGMTGALVVSGPQADKFGEGWVLVGDVPTQATL